MEYRIAREARDRYGLDEAYFSSRAQAADTAAARRAAWRIAREGGARPDRPVSGGDLAAIALIHELQHRAIDQANVITSGGVKGHGEDLAAFERWFPSRRVYVEGDEPRRYLRDRTEGTPNRLLTTEELLLLWVANRNPAFMRFDDLFDEAELVERTGYAGVVQAIRDRTAKEARKAGGQDLVERLLEPGRQAPGSLTEQLRWIAANWTDLVDDELLRLLTRAVDVLTEEEEGARRAWERHAGGDGAQPAALFGFAGAQDEPESFSPDRDWMPDLVLLAKSTYVWLDQLSRSYGRVIRTLDAIPDEELDTVRARGFTGLWLIGLWERSHASQRIKQLRGNPEAVASAYSLDDYRIADDLGGEDAWRDLRDRAWARGIRLAADMVPNHMGIDSRWVMEHPEWFIGRDEPPFPSYAWTGPNLSRDERVGIYLEDHYADGSDAAVVFKRVDRWSGAERYIYHGNDGTGIPWNDTAQLDFLNPEVREAGDPRHRGRRSSLPGDPLRCRHGPRPPPHPAAVVPPPGNRGRHRVARRVIDVARSARRRDACRVLARGGGPDRRRCPGHTPSGRGVLAPRGLLRAHPGDASCLQQRLHAHAPGRGQRGLSQGHP